MPPIIRSWISPFSPYGDIEHVAEAHHKIHLPGVQHRVLLPTLYGASYQGEPGIRRTLGNALCGRTAEDYAQIRANLEAVGVPCDGWSVPTYDGAPYQQGFKHGQCAAVFDYWMVNFEHGWADFWTPDGAGYMNQWIAGFWDGVADRGGTARLNGCVGVTMVTCSAMMNALDDDELRAWTEGGNFIANEAYIPGDPGLDPDNSLRIMRSRLSAIGLGDHPVILILERGDLPSMCIEYMNWDYGIQIWTLEIAAALTWPDDTQPDPEPEPQPEQNPCAGLISGLGVIGYDLLAPVVRLKRQPTAVQSLIDGIRDQCERNGINHA